MPNSYFIIEKDLDTIHNVRKVFEDFPEFSCKGITGDYEDAMNSILKATPDVVFVNIDSEQEVTSGDIFSYCSGIDEYISRKPIYIAVSLDETGAYKALKYKFFDYLLKPGRELEIRKIVLQLKKKQQVFLDNTLCLKSYKDFTLLEINDIIFLQADNNATDFVLIDGRRVSAFKTLKSFESELPKNFLRIHHSYIVNGNHISRINFGKLKCFLNHNKITLPFSRSYRHNLGFLEKLLSQKAITSN